MIAIANPYETLSQHGFANVVLNLVTNQKSLITTLPIEVGEVISFFNAKETFTKPTYLTVQTGINSHITLMPEFLQYINHSCNPNVFFDTSLMQLVCIKRIEPGEELCFFYPSSEWEMTQRFVCNCGSYNCLQLIKGAAYLSSEVASQYRFTDFIQRQLANASK